MKYTDQELGAYIVLMTIVIGIIICCVYGGVKLYVYCKRLNDAVSLLV